MFLSRQYMEIYKLTAKSVSTDLYLSASRDFMRAKQLMETTQLPALANPAQIQVNPPLKGADFTQVNRGVNRVCIFTTICR